MKKIKMIHVSFEEPLESSELPYFRAAVIEKAGREHVLFHNHLDDKKHLYKYPRIQYKIIHKRPALISIEEGTDELQHFFLKPSWDLMIKDKLYPVKVSKLFVKQYTLQVWNTSFRYYLKRWSGLSQKNFEIYQNITEETEKIKLLEKILIGNILSMAKSLNWQVDKEIQLKIVDLKKKYISEYKDTKVLCFDLVFDCNVSLPPYIGLGKHASTGFGIVRGIKVNKHQKQQL
jgi:hypothetical protein